MVSFDLDFQHLGGARSLPFLASNFPSRMTSFRGIEELSALGSKAQQQVALPSKVVNVVSVGGEPLSLWETFLLSAKKCLA